jgi:hypothetical protein
MVARTQEDALRHAAMGANRNQLEVQNENLLSDPGVITNFQFPREMNIDARLDDHPSADARAKQTQQPAFYGGRDRPGRKKKDAFGQVPKGFKP